jgi:hypothetical protein
MINDKKMKLVKSENGINWYLFKLSFFLLYYNDKSFKHKEEPPHRFSLSHKLHMMWYMMAIQGGIPYFILKRTGKFFHI